MGTDKPDLANDNLVNQWLEERRAFLAQYGNLANIKTFKAENTMHGESVQEFCQSMVDYLSRVHFEVFEKLLSSQSFVSRPEHQHQLISLIEKVEMSTGSLLDFNDKYLAIDDLDALTEDLSSLGEALAQRFELEDEVIALSHSLISDGDSAS